MQDERSLLGTKPEFNNLGRYLKAGKMTNHLEINVQEVAKKIIGINTEDIAKEIVIYINKNIPMIRNGKYNMKFNRTASQIIDEKVRNGCCDSSTLFVAIARTLGIPAMQIISFDKVQAKELECTNKRITDGHFFAGVFSKEDGKWYLVDPDKISAKSKDDVDYEILDLNNRNLKARFYAFAYVVDFSEVEINNKKIDSITNMGDIQRDVYEICDKIFIKEITKGKRKVEFDER